MTLRFVTFGLLIIALFTTIVLPRDTFADEGINQTLSFQGRLLRANGGVVPDGNYNVQFKIYQNGTGSAAGNPGGTLQWTESYVNDGGNSGIEVRNGVMSVNLGSNTPFGTSVDWNQTTLWLSLNVAGSAADCTTFNTGSCLADGEMLPMKRLTSSPYAMNAGAVGGKNSGELVQLGQGTQIDATNNASISINKLTGGGDFIQLQSAGVDIFKVNNIGDVTLGNGTSHTIKIADSESGADGQNLVVRAGTGGSGTGSNGGSLILKGGNGGGTNGDGSSVTIDGGTGSGTGVGGDIYIGTNEGKNILIGSTYRAINQNILIGNNDTAGSSTNIVIGTGSGASSGYTAVQAKDDVVIATNGVTRAIFDTDGKLTLGNDYSSDSPTGFTIQGTQSSASGVAGGALKIQGGQATTGDTNGGDISISGGAGSGAGVSGLVVLNTPTFKTVTDDANCYTSGAVVASNCTVATSSVNNSSAVVVGFSAPGQNATLPDPTNTTAGRIYYVTAADASEDFTLRANVSESAELSITMKQNTSQALLWNGSDWTPTDTNEQKTSLNDGDSGSANLLTLDQASDAPTISDDALLGSMYYDTTLGKVQCYEADGWGACGASPDSFITISPEYSNAVMNGTDIGTISSDLCSDELNINDGSSAQPTVCGSDETHNYYNWTSAETSAQTRSIYVTYQLPSNFKKFVAGSTSLLGRTDDNDAAVSYQVYRDNSTTGLETCGSSISVSTGAKTTWQTAAAGGSADPEACGFEAGDSILIRINLSSQNDKNAYVSDLNFAFSNN